MIILFFVGVYAVVALLGLYSEALQSMSGPQIREWIQLISNGSSDTWFTELPIKLPKIEGMDQADDGCNNLSVNTFIRGWIHAAEGIYFLRLLLSFLTKIYNFSNSTYNPNFISDVSE